MALSTALFIIGTVLVCASRILKYLDKNEK